jgi:PIN domain nuclease of toxin-antitoxin system
LHDDPFDRALIAQALANEWFEAYGVVVEW